MTTLTEGTHAGEFLVSEANAGSTGVSRSRDTITILSGEVLVAGAIIAMVTASGKYVERANAADGDSDGSETAVGILFKAVDATDGDAAGVGILRDAEFNTAEVVYKTGYVVDTDDTSAIAELAAVGIIGR